MVGKVRRTVSDIDMQVHQNDGPYIICPSGTTPEAKRVDIKRVDIKHWGAVKTLLTDLSELEIGTEEHITQIPSVSLSCPG